MKPPLLRCGLDSARLPVETRAAMERFEASGSTADQNERVRGVHPDAPSSGLTLRQPKTPGRKWMLNNPSLRRARAGWTTPPEPVARTPP